LIIFQNNLINSNLVYYYGLSYTDLDIFYILSKNPFIIISNNYIFNSTDYGVYTNESSNSYIISGNILLSSGIWSMVNGVNTANNTYVNNYGKAGGARIKVSIISDLT